MKYTAKIKSSRVITVCAETEAEALVMIENQLSKPGRYEIRNQWIANGSMVTVEGAPRMMTQAERDNARPADAPPMPVDPLDRLFR